MNSGMFKINLARISILKRYWRSLSIKVNKSNDIPEETCPGVKMQNAAKKLREKIPIGKLDDLEQGQQLQQETESLPPFPNNINPKTGEKGGPRGPEPTRYGDWERKGRVTDF